MKKTLVILSGGLDSTVLAYFIKASTSHELVGCVSINYGQRHSKELALAAVTCAKLGVPHFLLDLHGIRDVLGASSLTSDQPVPEGHYAEESMKQTVVPNRNMILMALAGGVAISSGASVVAYGAHSGDHDVYPDCRQDFADAMEKAFPLCDYRPLSLEAPFVQSTKAEIVALGVDLGVPFEDTWSCYNGGDDACGRCGTCVERLEAFELAKAVDPLPYTDATFYLAATANKH